MKAIRQFLIIFLSLFTSSVLSCGWFPTGEEFRFSLFQSNLAGHNDAYPLYYSSYFLNHYTPIVANGPRENLLAWQKNFDASVPFNDIDQLVYLATMEHLQELNNRSGEGFKAYNDNKLYRAFPKKEREEYLTYLMFARTNEMLLNQSDAWGELQLDEQALKDQLSTGISALEKSKIKELRVRYAYQCVVISRYLGGEEIMMQGIEIYKKYLSKSKHVLKQWALMHTAYMQSSLSALLNYTYEQFVIDYAMVFRNCDSKKEYIALNVEIANEQLPEILAVCADNTQKAAVLALTAFRNPGKSYDIIKRVYELDPLSPSLGLLLIREVNKLEDWYLTEKHTGYEAAVYSSCWNCQDLLEFIKAKNFQSDKAYLQKVLGFVSSMDLSKTGQAGLYKTIEAYLEFMLDHDDKARQLLSQTLATQGQLDPSLEGQIRALQLLLEVRSEKQNETTMLDHLKWLENHKNSIYNYDRFTSQLMLALSARYEQTGNNIPMAALCRSNVETLWDNAYHVWGKDAYFYYLDQNASASDVKKFIDLIGEGESDFVQYLGKELNNERDRLLDLLGTKHLRNDELQKALDVYRQVDTSLWSSGHYPEMLDCDPFYSEYYEKHTAIAGNKTYTKPEFVARLIELKNKIEANEPHKSYYQFLLGNAYFNMTKYGNSWYYIHYGWSTYDKYDPNYYEDEYYYSCTRANTYYMQAYENSKDKAYAAFCLRMSAKCEFYYADHEFDQEVRTTGTWDTKKDMAGLKNVYRKLKNEFPEEYDNLVRTCSYFDMYLDRWRYS